MNTYIDKKKENYIFSTDTSFFFPSEYFSLWLVEFIDEKLLMCKYPDLIPSTTNKKQNPWIQRANQWF